jgi:hypothetical protein
MSRTVHVLREYLEMFGVKSSEKIDKKLGCIWEFTNYIISGMDPRVKVVNKDPDNFQVSWND